MGFSKETGHRIEGVNLRIVRNNILHLFPWPCKVRIVGERFDAHKLTDEPHRRPNEGELLFQ
jgi:hypothetical protein